MKQRLLTATQEDYIEAIYAICSVHSVARVRDLAERLSVHKSTVTAALRQLSEMKLINYTPYEAATLTARGQRIGRTVMGRHETLTRFLTGVLGVDAATAEETACKMEHVIPAEVMERFTRFAEFHASCPHAGATWNAEGNISCGQRANPEQCPLCARRGTGNVGGYSAS